MSCFQCLVGDYTLCITLYEMMKKHEAQFPDHLPYLGGLPVTLRSRIFQYLKGQSLPQKQPGQVLVQPFFEKVVSQILNQDYSLDGTVSSSISNTTRSSLRCAGLVDLISMCEFI